jgi:hypothetical protein
MKRAPDARATSARNKFVDFGRLRFRRRPFCGVKTADKIHGQYCHAAGRLMLECNRFRKSLRGLVPTRTGIPG